MGMETKRAVCRGCHSRCRVLVHSENGRLVRIEEDKDYPGAGRTSPPTNGCLRLHGFREWFYHPDRVNFPLKRAGKKGEGKWQQIPWEQALDEVAERLKTLRANYGAETLALTVGTGRTYHEMEARFMQLFGSPNIVGATSICFGPSLAVGAAVMGWPQRHRTSVTLQGGGPGHMMAGSRCMLLIGLNPSEAWSRIWKSVLDAKKAGVKIIVIDPRRTGLAELADVWLQPRPSTDTALLLSMINVIIEEGLYDRDFVGRWCHGFDRLVERAKEYPTERVAELTWVPADSIREAARMYATNRPAYSHNGMGLEHQQDAIEAIHCRYILTALTGNVDVEGGMVIGGPSKCIREPEMELPEMLSAEQRAKQLGSDRFKLMSWPGYELISENIKRVWGRPYVASFAACIGHAPTMYRAMLTGKPYPVRALITMASNPMVTQPNTKLVYEALKSLELYLVCDYWRTPSAELADYILPVASWLERPFFWSSMDSGILCGEEALPSVIPGEYEHKDDYEILRGLGIRLGQADYWPWETYEEALDYQLKPLGVTFKDFMARGGYDFPPNEYKKYERMGFATTTGKFELYSTVFEKLGYDPLPGYHEPAETPNSEPKLAKDYPLMLITGSRFYPMFHSEHFNIDSVRRRHPHPLVQVNPETATKLEIKNGDWVWVETLRGRVRMKCQHFDGIDPRVVHCQHGWWFPELPGEEPWLHGVWESNVNVLTADDPDRCNLLSGGWPLRTALCRLYKVKSY